MARIRLALAQINPTVGDLDGNVDLVLTTARRAREQRADVVAFPEMALTGYPIEDLALRPSFQRAANRQVEALAAGLSQPGLLGLTVVVGALQATDDGATGPHNAAVVIRDGQVISRYAKHHLPNYGVFDERRLFDPGQEPCLVEVDGVRISVAICEDLWQTDSPAQIAARDRADVLLVINASPFELGKGDTRLELCRQRARETACTVAYVNCIGGQDELVFDGGSMVVRPDGSLAASGPRFVDDLMITSVGTDGAEAGPTCAPLDELEETYQALALGLGDYVRKNHQRSVVLGMSGGIDSALVGALAVDALGPDNVFGVAMPSVYSSSHSLSDAQDSAARTGMHLRIVPIAPMVEAFNSQLTLTGLAQENLQARVRGTTLMAISNSEGHLVLATGNKSELAVGYSTIYGDAVGGFGPIKDVPKTLVWKLARWRNEQAIMEGKQPPIPPNSIAKPPSAELRPDQLDSDSLPDYAELDAVLAEYIEGGVGTAELIERGFDPELAERVLRMTDGAEYKRRQYPPGTKITKLAFGRDRRIPITNDWRELRTNGG
ncbi:MAG: NAD+ synthase [Actinomycetes bacterium]